MQPPLIAQDAPAPQEAGGPPAASPAAVDPALRRAAARALAACAGCVGTATSFFLASVAPLPVPLYFPLARRWALSPRPLELSMDYYGRSLYALLGGLLAGLAVHAWARFWLSRPSWPGAPTQAPEPREAAGVPPQTSPAHAQAPARSSGLWLALLYALTALLLTAALFAYQLWGRVTFAEALTPPPAPPTAPP